MCLAKSFRSTHVAFKYSISFGNPHKKLIQRTFTSDSVNLVNDGRRRQNVHWRKKLCSPSKNINCFVKMCHIFVQTHPHYCTCNIFFLQHTFVGFWSLSGQVKTLLLLTSATHTHVKSAFSNLRFSFLTSSFGSMITIGGGW